MIFETAFRRSLLSPSFIQFGDDRPRRPDEKHWVGREPKVPKGQNQSQGGGNDNSNKPGKYDSRGCRRVETIPPGEVKRAYQFYEKQLTPTSYGSFIAANHFYMIDLAERDGVPAVLFGRANVCLPGDGPIQNMRELELSLPQKDKEPDPVVLHPRDIPSGGNVRSYAVRVKFLATEEDRADFAGFENLFLEAGFALEYEPGYLEWLPHLKEAGKSRLPLFHVVSSRWFASVPLSVQEEVRSGLKQIVGWDNLLLNYHPDHLSAAVTKLNLELGFQYGFTEVVLIEPRSPRQVLQIIQPTFEKIFAQPIK